MLAYLHIQNFTIIDELNIDFSSGMTVLTGETGAGKSIIIDALEFVMGKRADTGVIRHGCEQCSISASFEISALPEVQQWLLEQGLESDNECLLRRVLAHHKPSKNFINGHPCPLNLLKELGSHLVQIHGQHQHQALMKSTTQRQRLDLYAKNESLATQVACLYDQWQQASLALKHLQNQLADRTARIDYLQFQLQELDELAPQANEFETLDQQQKQSAHLDEIRNYLDQTLHLLHEGDSNIIHHLYQTQTILTKGLKYLPQLQSSIELLNNAVIQIEEASSELNQHYSHLETDPRQQQLMEKRLSRWFELARKHKIQPQQLYDFHQQLLTELEQLENSSASVGELEKNMHALRSAYSAAAKQLSASRMHAAEQLAPKISEQLHKLNMSAAQFTIELLPLEKDSLSKHGLETIDFQVTTNPGQPLQSLAKVVSGGELSRISLAIEVLTQSKQTTPTIIFDEVDTGIGGKTAAVVGQLLRALGQKAQVLCVTHLPQVAAYGHNHFFVEKRHTADHATTTDIIVLTGQQKVNEIARMLGGEKITQQTIAHAEELLSSLSDQA